LSLNASIEAAKGISSITKLDTLKWRSDVFFTTNITLTPNWSINATTGYDFINKQVTATSMGLSRNLHCWEMSFNFIPFGDNKSYFFQLAPKSSLLHDLKVTRRKSFWDYR
jgi:hypothetical protein